MRRRGRFPLLAVGIAVLACFTDVGPLMSADADGNYARRGVGRQDCKAYVAAAASGNRNSVLQGYLGYIEGFYTGMNLYEKDTYDVLPFAHAPIIGIIMDRYCKKNPDENFVLALRKVAMGLRGRRLEKSSPMVQATAEGQTIFIYREMMVRLQQKLANDGYYSGTIDGGYGPATQEAIGMFQLTEGLNATGLPDPATVWLALAP